MCVCVIHQHKCYCFPVSEWGNSLQLLIITGLFETDEIEIIDVDKRTHQCVDSAPPLPDLLLESAMGGLLHDKYPLICGGKLFGGYSDECHVIDVEGNMIAPTLPVKIAYSGYAVVNNSWLWIAGGTEEIDTLTNEKLTTNASWYIFVPSQYIFYVGRKIHINTNYYMRAIISCDLYIFYPIFPVV